MLGKLLFVIKLINKNKKIELSISYTSRPIRKKESQGVDYFFVKKKNFIDLRNKKYFIETAKVFDYLYGSPYENIKTIFSIKKTYTF